MIGATPGWGKSPAWVTIYDQASINYLIIIFLCYLIAMALVIFAIQPRSYTWHRYQSNINVIFCGRTMQKVLYNFT